MFPDVGTMSANLPLVSQDDELTNLANESCLEGSLESVESELSIENDADFKQVAPHDVGVLSISSNRNNNMCIHTFAYRTVIQREYCEVCEKRIKFGNAVLCCPTCLAACHPACKESLPPCTAPDSTPITDMGVIADYAPTTQPMVPAIIQLCVEEIEARGLYEHGLYRVPGSVSEVRALKEKCMKCRVPNLSVIHIYVICDCMKDFLCSLKEPLVTHVLWWQFAQAAETHDIEERQVKIYQAVYQLPQPNRETLSFIILHLLRVAENKDMNKMPLSNLSKVLGVAVVGYPAEYNENETYTLELTAKLVLEQFLMIPAEYWEQVILGQSSPLFSPVESSSHYSPRTPFT